jgi:hypothetical protein
MVGVEGASKSALESGYRGLRPGRSSSKYLFNVKAPERWWGMEGGSTDAEFTHGRWAAILCWGDGFCPAGNWQLGSSMSHYDR